MYLKGIIIGGNINIDTRSDYGKTGIYIGLLIVGIIIGAILVLRLHWITVGAFLLVGLGLFFLVKWHAKNTTYICPYSFDFYSNSVSNVVKSDVGVCEEDFFGMSSLSLT